MIKAIFTNEHKPQQRLFCFLDLNIQYPYQFTYKYKIT